MEANSVFDVYRKLYFEGGTSSVYYFETDEEDTSAFGACFLIHKDVTESKSLKSGWWDSIHVVDVSPAGKGSFTYKLTTTVMISMQLADGSIGTVDLSGTMTQQTEKKKLLDVEHTHIQNIGTMVEDMELKLRQDIEGIYIQKTRQVVNGMRNPDQEKNLAWEGIANALKSM